MPEWSGASVICRKVLNGTVVKHIIILIFIGVIITGCAALPKSSVLFQHTPILPQGTVQVKAGMEKFVDKRSEKEKKCLKNITDIADQITSVFCRDFRDAELFESVKLGYDPEAVDVIIKGEIKSFFWKSGHSATAYIPYINLIHLLGVPSGENKGRVEIVLELVNANTGEIISKYSEATDSKKFFTIYQYTSHRGSGGEETSDAFRMIVDLLVKDIVADRKKIESSVHITKKY